VELAAEDRLGLVDHGLCLVDVMRRRAGARRAARWVRERRLA
jgi:hypothetical protein